MSFSYPPKDPSDNIDYVVDWTRRLDGDAIANSAWVISGSNTGLTITSNNYTSNLATVWLANGNPGKMAIITNTIHTLGGRIWEVSVNMQIRQN